MNDRPDQSDGRGRHSPVETTDGQAVWDAHTRRGGGHGSPLYRPSDGRGRGRRRRDPAWDRPAGRRREGRRVAAARSGGALSRPTGRPRRRRRPGAELRRLRRLIALGLVLVVTAVTLGSTLRSNEPAPPAPHGPKQAALLPSGPPRPQLLATREALRLYVPVAQRRITAIAYHRIDGADTLSIEPKGRLLNAGLVEGLEQRLLGSSNPAGPAYYVTDGSTASVDVGAPAGTTVYSPVTGQIVGITPYVVNGSSHGSSIQIQPDADPGVVVVVSNVLESRALAVGGRVSASQSLLGTIEDMSRVLDQHLARYTQDAGNHVHLEVQPSTAIPIP